MTTYTFTTLTPPGGSPAVIPQSINDKGQVVGSYYPGTNGNNERGFLYSNGAWTTLSDPSAALIDPSADSGITYTVAMSINDKGQVVGSYYNGTTVVGFLYSNGTYTTLSDPSAGPGGGTVPVSINDKGQVTGSYSNGTTNVGFLYSNGTWTTLSDPSAPGGYTVPTSINDKGQIAGILPGGTQIEGFLYSKGTWTTLNDPSAVAYNGTYPESINDKGQVTGWYYNGTTDEGFLYSNGTLTNLSDPSAGANGSTIPRSINDKGQVVGEGSVGFLYSHGTWTTLSDPAAEGFTAPTSINERGQIIGQYNNGTSVLGFIATPTDIDHKREPPTLTITDHSLSVSADGTVALPISVSAKDADDTVSVKISGVPSFDKITAGDGHVVTKKGDSYTFTEADVLSGLTLHSSSSRGDHHHNDEATLTVTAAIRPQAKRRPRLLRR